MQRWVPGKLCYLGFCRGRLNPVGRKCQESKWGICIILHWAKPPNSHQFANRSKGLLPDIFDPLITTLLELCSKVSVFIIVSGKRTIGKISIISMTVKAAWCTLMIIFSGVTLIEKLVERRKGKKGQLYIMKKSFLSDRWTIAIKRLISLGQGRDNLKMG